MKLKDKIKTKLISWFEKEFQEELIGIVNRPREGEIVKIENIKINKYFRYPSKDKLRQRASYYRKYRYFRSGIVLDNNNYLVDGYTTYLLAKRLGFDCITIVRKY